MKDLSPEQCEKLKELGFPQNTRFRWIIPNGNRGSRYSLQYSKDQNYKTRAFLACPNSDEIIDWLGKDFRAVEKSKSGEYVATSYKTVNSFGIFGNLFRKGTTAVDALYNAALAIKS